MIRRDMMSRNHLLRTFPSLHPKVLECIPAVFGYNYNDHNKTYIVSQAKEVNYELLMSLSAETKEEQPVAFDRFIAAKMELISNIRGVTFDFSPVLFGNKRTMADDIRILRTPIS